jgi:hypothetical protein
MGCSRGIRNAWRVGRYHGQSRCQRLDERYREALVPGGERNCIGSGEQLA